MGRTILRTMAASVDELVSMVIFGRVVEGQSFTAAAQKTGLSKSAVSARVADLERLLGVRLLNRTTRRLSLTEAGVEVYARCARMIAEADSAALAAHDLSETVSGTLKINAPQALSRSYLAPLLQRFLEKHPALRIDLTVENRFIDVLHDGFDLVVRIASAQRMRDSNIASRKLATDELIVCGAPAYLHRRGRPASPRELIAHACLRYSVSEEQQHWRYLQDGKWLSVPTAGQFGSNDAEVLLQAAIAGSGLLFAPSLSMRAALASGGLERVLADVQFPEVAIYALFAHRKHVPARVRETVNFLASALPPALK